MSSSSGGPNGEKLASGLEGAKKEADASPTGGNAVSQTTEQCPKCDCCGEDAHSKGQSITEDQFYGLEPVTCANGTVVPADPPNAQSYIRNLRAQCPGQFSQPPCNNYFIATADEKHAILRTWKGNKGGEARAAIGAADGEDVSHRVPKAAGGCPVGKGNLTKSSDLSAECQKAEGTLANRQGKRATLLRAGAGV